MKNLTLEYDADFGDETLMDELLHRDASALEELYVRYRPILRGVILRVVNDECETDDVLQEVFLQLWTQAGHYSASRGKPLGWLITMARRRAIDRLRQRAAYRRATDRFETESQTLAWDSSETQAIEVAAFQGDIQALVHSAMRRLPEKQKLVVECAFFRGMSQREISVQMAIPLGTVKTRIDLGMRKLASALAGARRKMF